MTTAIEPYRVDVPEAVLGDLRERLARTRWPDQLPGTAWAPGAPLDAVRRLCAYWAEQFDWRAVEARLNGFDQFVTEAHGERLHFLHVRSPEDDALPLVLTHGWPGSVVEFLEVIGPLADPVAHGGEAADAFHVVVPSIPGYGFSGPTRHTGVDVATVAAAVAELMSRLGYDRYGAQGGDWGSMVSRRLGGIDAAHVVGVHVNMFITGPPEGGDAMEGVTEAEVAAMTEAGEVMKTGVGYMQLQSTKPQTLSYGLTDSPAGLAAWILDKLHAWTDHGPEEDSALTPDQMLANITTYWVTGTAHSAARLYYESARARTAGQDLSIGRSEVPTGYAAYPGELFRPPRRWVEAACNLVHYAEMPRGGHFAAWEQPELFVDDVRTFFRLVRP